MLSRPHLWLWALLCCLGLALSVVPARGQQRLEPTEVSVIAFSPQFPGDGLVLAATSRTVADDPSGAFLRFSVLSRSQDGGKTWAVWDGLHPTATMHALAFSPEYATDRTFFVASDDGVLAQSGESDWLPSSLDQPTRALAVSPEYARDRTVFAAVAEPGGGIWRSTDGANEFVDLRRGLPADAEVTALAISPAYARDRTLYAATRAHGVYRSTDGGETWAAFGRGLGTPGAFVPLEQIAVLGDGLTLLAGSAGRGLYRSADGGATWTSVTAGLAPDASVTALAVVPDAATVLLGTAEGLYRSDDAGASWRRLPLGSGLQTEEVASIALSPGFVRDGTAMVGLRRSASIYRTGDGGATWAASAELALMPGPHGEPVDAALAEELRKAAESGALKERLAEPSPTTQILRQIQPYLNPLTIGLAGLLAVLLVLWGALALVRELRRRRRTPRAGMGAGG